MTTKIRDLIDSSLRDTFLILLLNINDNVKSIFNFNTFKLKYLWWGLYHYNYLILNIYINNFPLSNFPCTLGSYDFDELCIEHNSLDLLDIVNKQNTLENKFIMMMKIIDYNIINDLCRLIKSHYGDTNEIYKYFTKFTNENAFTNTRYIKIEKSMQSINFKSIKGFLDYYYSMLQLTKLPESNFANFKLTTIKIHLNEFIEKSFAIIENDINAEQNMSNSDRTSPTSLSPVSYTFNNDVYNRMSDADVLKFYQKQTEINKKLINEQFNAKKKLNEVITYINSSKVENNNDSTSELVSEIATKLNDLQNKVIDLLNFKDTIDVYMTNLLSDQLFSNTEANHLLSNLIKVEVEKNIPPLELSLNQKNHSKNNDLKLTLLENQLSNLNLIKEEDSFQIGKTTIVDKRNKVNNKTHIINLLRINLIYITDDQCYSYVKTIKSLLYSRLKKLNLFRLRVWNGMEILYSEKEDLLLDNDILLSLKFDILKTDGFFTERDIDSYFYKGMDFIIYKNEIQKDTSSNSKSKLNKLISTLK